MQIDLICRVERKQRVLRGIGKQAQGADVLGVVVGIAVLGEPGTPMRVIGAVLFVSGLVVLKLASSH